MRKTLTIKCLGIFNTVLLAQSRWAPQVPTETPASKNTSKSMPFQSNRLLSLDTRPSTF